MEKKNQTDTPQIILNCYKFRHSPISATLKKKIAFSRDTARLQNPGCKWKDFQIYFVDFLRFLEKNNLLFVNWETDSLGEKNLISCFNKQIAQLSNNISPFPLPKYWHFSKTYPRVGRDFKWVGNGCSNPSLSACSHATKPAWSWPARSKQSSWNVIYNPSLGFLLAWWACSTAGGNGMPKTFGKYGRGSLHSRELHSSDAFRPCVKHHTWETSCKPHIQSMPEGQFLGLFEKIISWFISREGKGLYPDLYCAACRIG